MAKLYPEALIDAQGDLVDFETGIPLPNYTGFVLVTLAGYQYVMYLTLNPDGTRRWQVVYQGSQLVMAEIDEFLKNNQKNG
jgi:hypothetical protein